MTPLNAHWIYDAMLLAIKATGGYSGYATLFMLDWKFTPRAFGSFPDFSGELISQLYREKQRGEDQHIFFKKSGITGFFFVSLAKYGRNPIRSRIKL